MKRYLYIIIGIIAVAIVAIAAIISIKKGGSSAFLGLGGSLPSAGTQTAGNGAAPSSNGASSSSGTASGTMALGQGAPAQTFGIVSDGPILDYFVNASNTITAIEPDGEVISIANGSTTIVSSTTIPNIISASFSYDGKKVLVSSGDPMDPHTDIFSVPSASWTSGPTGMISPQWSPERTYSIAYLVTQSSGLTTLAIRNAANLAQAPITETSLMATGVTLQWPSKNIFILSDKPTNNDTGSIWAFNAATGKFSPIAYELSGAETTWGLINNSTIGVLFNDTGITSQALQLVSPTGASIHSLSFITLPSKCAFAANTTTIPASPTAQTTTAGAATTSTSASAAATMVTTSSPYLYCGVPQDQTSFTKAALPDAYNMMSLFTADELLRVNLTTGGFQVLRSDATPHVDATDLKVANNILFFVNRYDQKLYALTLPQ